MHTYMQAQVQELTQYHHWMTNDGTWAWGLHRSLTVYFQVEQTVQKVILLHNPLFFPKQSETKYRQDWI
jgi:hypothetical protein